MTILFKDGVVQFQNSVPAITPSGGGPEDCTCCGPVNYCRQTGIEVPSNLLHPIQVGVRTVITGSLTTWTWASYYESESWIYLSGTRCLHEIMTRSLDISVSVPTFDGTYFGGHSSPNSQTCPVAPEDILDFYNGTQGFCYLTMPLDIPAKVATGTMRRYAYLFQQEYSNPTTQSGSPFIFESDKTFSLTGSAGLTQARMIADDGVEAYRVTIGCVGNGSGIRSSDVFRVAVSVPVGTPALGVPDYMVPWNATPPEHPRTTVPSTTCRLRSYSGSFPCNWFEKNEATDVASSAGCQTTPQRRDTSTYTETNTVPNPSVVTELYAL